MKSDQIYVEHIIDAINLINKYLKGVSFEEFYNDSLLQDGVIRQFSIIGEAANKLSGDFKKENSEIPWKEIITMRNKLIHDYFGVDLEVVWGTAKEFLADLKRELKKQ